MHRLHPCVRTQLSRGGNALQPGQVRAVGLVHHHPHAQGMGFFHDPLQGNAAAIKVRAGQENGPGMGVFLHRPQRVLLRDIGIAIGQGGHGNPCRPHAPQHAAVHRGKMGVARENHLVALPGIQLHHDMDARGGAVVQEDGFRRPGRPGIQLLRPADAPLRAVQVVGDGKLRGIQGVYIHRAEGRAALVPGHVKAAPPRRFLQHIVDGSHGISSFACAAHERPHSPCSLATASNSRAISSMPSRVSSGAIHACESAPSPR